MHNRLRNLSSFAKILALRSGPLKVNWLRSDRQLVDIQQKAHGASRIQYLDGLRGIAILSVLLFHAYSRWESIEPYQQASLAVSLFEFGWLGVQLFFAISGYVIYMSLHRSDNPVMFGISRWLRLFPAMLVASLIIFVTSIWVPEMPYGNSDLINLLPSLTFLDPATLSTLLNTEVGSMDGAFWSLYVEVKFYAIAAIMFFIFKDRRLFSLLFLYTSYVLLSLILKFEPLSDLQMLVIPHAVLNYWGFSFYAWFLVGIYSYVYAVNGDARYLLGAILIGMIGVLQLGLQGYQTAIFAFAVLVVFVLPMLFEPFNKLLQSRFFLFFGFVSYPLYLLHQNLVTGLSIKFYQANPNIHPVLYPMPFMVLVIVMAWLLARAEPTIKRSLKSAIPGKAFGIRLR